MKYQDCAELMQAPDKEVPDGETGGDFASCDAHINSVTGLATDYLNHFNEAIMLLEMPSDTPDCLNDFLNWRPNSYREQFAASRFKGRAVAIAAYAADPNRRASLDALTSTMNALLQATGAALRSSMPPQAVAELAVYTVFWLKPLVALAGAAINGETDLAVDGDVQQQAAVDALMQRSLP